LTLVTANMSATDGEGFEIATALRIAALLDAKLKPIATRTVDLNDPAWVEKLRTSRPLDEAGIRQEAETLLGHLLNAYDNGAMPLRAEIRALFAANPNFAWATGPAQPANTLDGFRARVLFISARDQAQDLRDATLLINELCMGARMAGIDPAPILNAVADISSEKSDHSNPSMADLLRRPR